MADMGHLRDLHPHVSDRRSTTARAKALWAPAVWEFAGVLCFAQDDDLTAKSKAKSKATARAPRSSDEGYIGHLLFGSWQGSFASLRMTNYKIKNKIKSKIKVKSAKSKAQNQKRKIKSAKSKAQNQKRKIKSPTFANYGSCGALVPFLFLRSYFAATAPSVA
jgi:hypothetical protein